MIGDTSYQIVFIWLVLSISGSAAVLAAVLVVAAVPRGALMLVGGAVTDQFSPRTVMLASHLARGSLVTVLTATAIAGQLQIWQFYLIGALFGIADAFFWPASGAILTTLVDASDLPRANAMLSVAEQISLFAGPVLGALLLTTAGSSVALGFNAVTFFVAATALLAAPKGAAATSADAGLEAGPPRYSVAQLLGQIRGGLNHAGRNAELRMVLLFVSAATLSYSGLFAVGLPALAREHPHGAIALGVMVSASGLGQLVGAVAAGVTGLFRQWGLVIITMAVLEGAGFALLGLRPNYLLAAAILAVLGAGAAYSTDVALPTYLQTRTPRELLGRVNSVIELPRVTLEPVSIALMGALAAVGVRWVFVFAAVPMFAVAIAFTGSRSGRRLDAAAS
jgi:MFS family permease